MIKKINMAEEIDKKYPATILNKHEHKRATKEMNEVMKNVRRDFLYKSKKSEESASRIFFTS